MKGTHDSTRDLVIRIFINVQRSTNEFAGWLMHCTMSARRRRRTAWMTRARLSHRQSSRVHKCSNLTVQRLGVIVRTPATRLRRISSKIQTRPKSPIACIRSLRSAVKSLPLRLTPVAAAALPQGLGQNPRQEKGSRWRKSDILTETCLNLGHESGVVVPPRNAKLFLENKLFHDM